MSDVTDYLDQVQARADAATPAPWWTTRDLRPAAVFAGDGAASDLAVSEAFQHADAEFIAAARTDVPRLVAALRAVLELHESFEFDGARRCRECADYDDRDYSAPWPCPTVQAVTEALEVG